jgi:hypothetical protein
MGLPDSRDMPSQRFSSRNFPPQVSWFWRFALASLPHRGFADAVAVLAPTEGIHEAGIEGIVAIRYSHPIARTPVLCDSYIALIAQGPKVWPIRLIKSSGRCVASEGATARGILDAFRRPDPGCGNAPGKAAGVGIHGIEQRCAPKAKSGRKPSSCFRTRYRSSGRQHA